MLEAIISFMPTEGQGAIGALDWTAEERKKLAIEVTTYHLL
jgi:ubiquitin-conjugating enzyme E2 J1